MNFVILLMVVLINANVEEENNKFNKQCQTLQCNTTTEICRRNPKCNDSLLKCVYCALKTNQVDNQNITFNESSYDEYYEYDEDETSDKTEFNEENEYLDDYIEPLDRNIDRLQPIRKLGICPKVVQAIGKCDTEQILQPDCRFDRDCPGDFKCCEAACGRRVCNMPIKTTFSLCPASFECSLNCRLGYQIDSNGCLKCECQSCPSMDQCTKNCLSGYLKDLFGCDICECNYQCPPFSCNLFCPPGIGFIQSENGCPLCQCAISKSQPIEHTSSCQEDVHCPPGFRCLNDARNVPMCQAVPGYSGSCPIDFVNTCDLQCPNGNYLLDGKGCPLCACAPACPQVKCRANCGDGGYALDDNGCQTCKCLSKETIKCSGLMCRMFCQYGFKRDENGCELCACNELPQQCPQLNCENTCSNGYQKDYSGCPTCECKDESEKSDVKCKPVICDLNCKYGLQRDEFGCQLCLCNSCPMRTCRMHCMYGFRKNEDDGCEICECDWSPVAEKIQCDERIPCQGTRVCNLNLRLCETVNPDLVNWFLYDFEIDNEIFRDDRFIQTFKNGFINNVATKYGLEITQITVSSVEEHGLTSFQIMPFANENMEIFDKKMDQIDIDLNSHEFRAVLPAVAQAIDGNNKPPSRSDLNRWCQKFRNLIRSKSMFLTMMFLLAFVGVIFVIGFLNIRRRYIKLSNRSESKTAIYDGASYHLASTDDEHYEAVHAPDGTPYIVIASDDTHSSKEKGAMV